MVEKGKFSDAFNSLNGNISLRNSALEKSNKLRSMGIDSVGQIDRIYKSGDFLAFYDPLKLKNLEMFGIDNDVTDNILVLEVMDKQRGSKVFQFVNVAETSRMKTGDILTVNPEVEGKEASTEFDKDFIEFCKNIIREKYPDMAPALEETKDEDFMKALGLNNFEDLVYVSAKEGGLEQQISNRLSVPEHKKEFFEKLKVGENAKSKENQILEKSEGQPEEEQNEEGMSLEEASEVLDVDVDILKKSLGENAKILGVKNISDMEGLERQLGKSLNGITSRGILVKVSGPGIQEQGYALSPEGNVLYSPEMGDSKLISELVATGENGGEDIDDIDRAIKERDSESKKIETINPLTGEKVIEFAEQGKENAILSFESESQTLLKEVVERINAIMESEVGDKSDKLNMVSDVLYNARETLEHLQEAYNVREEDSLNSIEKQAEKTGEDAEIEKAKRLAGKIGAVAVGGRISLLNNDEKEAEDDGLDERDPRSGGPRSH